MASWYPEVDVNVFKDAFRSDDTHAEVCLSPGILTAASTIADFVAFKPIRPDANLATAAS